MRHCDCCNWCAYYRLKNMHVLLSIARSSIGKFFIGWIFEHMSFVIPVKRLHESEILMAFHHPKPSYPTHILLVPKRAVRGLEDLSPEDDLFLTEVFHTVQSLVDELNLTASGYRLILNGGEYQDVPQLHFHLIADEQSPIPNP